MMNADWTQAPGYDMTGFESAAGSSTVGVDVPARAKRCIANDHTCKGWRVKASQFCAGHLKKMGLMDGNGRKISKGEIDAVPYPTVISGPDALGGTK